MSNDSIQIGIDLGTTNSEAALNINDNIEILKNIYGDSYTPSVFGFDKAKNKVVGKKAYEKIYREVEEVRNFKTEVKRLMGTSETVFFPRVNREMNAEEISAEILGWIKGEIQRKYPEVDTSSVVITYPAYFSTLQAESTRRAGELAGFKHVVLLQEPIAAAIAYGFMREDNENWLIYDLGGGTFDVALISSRSGSLSVLSHAGNNFLGGKDFDHALIDKILIPRILSEYSFKEFTRGNAKYKDVFTKLKYLAELAKIELSQYDSTIIEVDNIGCDDNDREVYLSVKLSLSEYESIIEAYISETINLVQDVVDESGISPSSINKIVLVGAAAQTPLVRRKLAEKYDVAIDGSVDAMTAVSKGACIFGASQLVPDKCSLAPQPDIPNAAKISLNYTPLTAETEVTITGMVDLSDDSSTDYYLQISSSNSSYVGSKIKLKKGKFIDALSLESNKPNHFILNLSDARGNAIPTTPGSFTITHGISISGAPLPYSVGVAVAKKDANTGIIISEEYDRILNKGEILPLKSEPRTYRTAKTLKKGEDNDLLIKISEGESNIPDRNNLVCTVSINGRDLPYDLPSGTPLELSLEVNESRETKVGIYIPLIDKHLDARGSYYTDAVDVGELRSELDVQEYRFNNLKSVCSDDEVNVISDRFQLLEGNLTGDNVEEDEKRLAEKRLRDLKMLLDRYEASKQMPQLTKEFHDRTKWCFEVIDNLSLDSEKEKHMAQYESLHNEGKQAIVDDDKDWLMRVNNQLGDFSFSVMYSNPATWVYEFDKIVKGNYAFSNPEEANYYIKQGEIAKNMTDIDELKRCVRNLFNLMSQADQSEVQGSISGITK